MFDKCRVLGFAFLGMIGIAGHAYGDDGQIGAPYAVYTHGFHVADADANYRLTDWGYGINTHIKAGGLLSLFLRMDVSSSANGRFIDGSAEPVQYSSGGYSRGQSRSIVIHYDNRTPTVTTLQPKEPDRETVPASDLPNAIDTLSAMALLLSTLQHTGHCDGSSRVFDGLRLTMMKAHGPTPTIIPTETGEVFRGAGLRCDFIGQQTAGFVKGSSHLNEMKAAHPGAAWFQNVPGVGLVAVRIEFDHPKMGKIIAVLQRRPTLSRDH